MNILFILFQTCLINADIIRRIQIQILFEGWKNVKISKLKTFKNHFPKNYLPLQEDLFASPRYINFFTLDKVYNFLLIEKKLSKAESKIFSL